MTTPNAGLYEDEGITTLQGFSRDEGMKLALFKVSGLTETEQNSIAGTIELATLSEIKQAHGKCGECKWVKHDNDGVQDWHVCKAPHANSYGELVFPTTDYCNHYEPKEAI